MEINLPESIGVNASELIRARNLAQKLSLEERESHAVFVAARERYQKAHADLSIAIDELSSIRDQLVFELDQLMREFGGAPDFDFSAATDEVAAT